VFIGSFLKDGEDPTQVGFMFHMLVTLAILGLAAVASICVPNAGVVLNYLGAIPGSVLLYILPGAEVYSLNRRHLPFKHKEVMFPFLLMCIGFGLMALGIFVNAAFASTLDAGANLQLSKMGETEVSYYDPNDQYRELRLTPFEKAERYQEDYLGGLMGGEEANAGEGSAAAVQQVVEK
jgi:hypothetical protein